MDRKEAFARAYGIAKRDLRRCYTQKGILAGLKRFDDYWARDSFFASFGSCRLGDFKQVKKNLLLFLKYQKKDGQLPRRIDRHVVGLKYLRIPIKRKNLRPRYTTSLMYCYSVDQNSLFVISLLNYVKQSGDYRFLKGIYKDVKRAMDWNFSNDRERNLLINEGYFANWEDTVFWRGELLYTNILHYWALRDFADLSRIAGVKGYEMYIQIADKVMKMINSQFWNGNYYEKRRKTLVPSYFSIDGNMLAVVSGIADREKAGKIMEYMKTKGLDKEVPMRSTYPRYPLWKNSPARLITLSTGYHSTYSWIWVSCMFILAEHDAGRKEDALAKLELLCRKIIEYDGIYEVYAQGKPVKGIFTMSDYPFAWSAGLFVYAYNILIKPKNI